ncbi:hypothetical protein NJB1907f34b_37300 [Mycobacterium marinum]|nr:hypothetical protein NJB1907f34b_37300 [Mycobacterium marinum]GJO78047.1 hypothetical protein NJB1907f34a_45550 [Mycobacterium marinum]
MPMVAPFFRVGQRAVDGRGRAGGVQVDIGARLAREQCLPRTVQIDEPLGEIFLGGIDDRVGTHLERLVQAGLGEISDRDVRGADRLERQHRAQTDWAGTEDQDLVRRLWLALVYSMAGHRHRLVERGHFERYVLGNDLQAYPAHRLLDEEIVRQRATGSAVADDAVGGGHRIDDDVVTDGEARYPRADRDHLAGGFVPERHPASMGR